MSHKIALVVFDLNQPADIQKEYAYRTTIPVEKGTICVVEVTSNGRPDLKLVEVVHVIEDTLENSHIANKATKYIVDAVDLSSHKERLEKTERLKYVKNKLEERKAKIEEIAVFELLAKADPEAAKLLEEMKTLTLDMQVTE